MSTSAVARRASSPVVSAGTALQAGGHRFDPGTLHSEKLCKRALSVFQAWRQSEGWSAFWSAFPTRDADTVPNPEACVIDSSMPATVASAGVRPRRNRRRDLAASERFYRTVLSVLDAEPSHADAELVEWEDWDIGPTDREHPVTRGLHVGFRAPSRVAVDAFWQAGIDAGYRDGGAPARARSTGRTTTAASCSTRTATARRRCTRSARPRARRPRRPPLDPRPRSCRVQALLRRRSLRTPGCGLAWTSRTTSRWSARTSASR